MVFFVRVRRKLLFCSDYVMEFLFFGYRSADFDKNYAKYNGENSRNLVRSGFLL